MKTFKWVLLGLLFFASAAASGLGFSAPKRKAVPLEKIVIADGSQPAGAVLYAAVEKKFFQKYGLEPVFRQFLYGKPALESLRLGKADLATVGETPFMHAVMQGERPQLIAAIGKSAHHFGILCRPETIRTFADLRGRRIGVPVGTAAEYFVNLFLNLHGITRKEVTVVDIEPDKLGQALRSGEIDAAAVWEEILSQIRESFGGRLVFFDDEGAYSFYWNIVGMRDYVSTHGPQIEKFLRALYDGERWCDAHEKECQEITARYTKTKVDYNRRLWSYQNLTLSLSQSLLVTCENQARWFLSVKKEGKGMPNFLDYFYKDGLKKVHPESIGLIE